MMPAIALGGSPGLMIRKVWPRSTDPNQTLRCVPVPVGPLTKDPPEGINPNVRLAVRVDRIHHGWYVNLMGGGVLCQQGVTFQRSIEVHNQCQQLEPSASKP